MADFNIKQNDTGPSLQGTFTPLTVLTGATVVFSMKNSAGVVKVSRKSCTIVDALLGVVKYDWLAADTDTADLFEGEFEATLSDSSIVTHPNADNLKIRIFDDIA